MYSLVQNKSMHQTDARSPVCVSHSCCVTYHLYIPTTIICHNPFGSIPISSQLKNCDGRGCIVFKSGGININWDMFDLASSVVMILNSNYWDTCSVIHNQRRDICVADVLSRQCACSFIMFHLRFMDASKYSKNNMEHNPR